MEYEQVAASIMTAFSRMNTLRFKVKKREGLNPSERMTIFTVKHLQEEQPAGVKITDISKQLDVAPPTVTQRVTALEEMGYLVRTHSMEDRRTVLVSLSDKAKTHFDQMHHEMLKRSMALVKHLGIDESRHFAATMEKTIDFLFEYNRTVEGKQRRSNE